LEDFVLRIERHGHFGCALVDVDGAIAQFEEASVIDIHGAIAGWKRHFEESGRPGLSFDGKCSAAVDHDSRGRDRRPVFVDDTARDLYLCGGCRGEYQSGDESAPHVRMPQGCKQCLPDPAGKPRL
jgi:hypothetical protein